MKCKFLSLSLVRKPVQRGPLCTCPTFSCQSNFFDFQRHAEKALLQKCSQTMSRRFTPDERCLGGVQEIHADYTNMRRKLLTAKPQVPITADLQPATSFSPGS